MRQRVVIPRNGSPVIENEIVSHRLSPDADDAGFRVVTFDQVKSAYADQVRALIEGGVDILMVETIFDWPGLGLYATKSVVTQDFMPVIGVTLVIGTLFVAANLVIDLLYGLVDPKVRVQ